MVEEGGGEEGRAEGLEERLGGLGGTIVSWFSGMCGEGGEEGGVPREEGRRGSRLGIRGRRGNWK